MKRSKEDTEKTKMAILAAAEKLFINKGYTSTTLEKIASEAGCTRGAIHWHFVNRVGLLLALKEKEKTPIQELAERLKENNSIDPLESLLKTTQDFFARMENEPGRRELMQLMLELSSVESEDTGICAHRDFTQKFRENTLQIFMIAKERGCLDASWKPENAALIFFGLMSGLVCEWLKGGETDYSMTDASHAVTALIQSLHAHGVK